MPKLKKTLTVHHSPEDLYQLVKDIRAYPEFIKWIEQLTVANERTEHGLYKCTGTAAVGFKGFSERFSTDVIGDPDKCQIDVSLVRGPFRHLRNQWRFREAGEGRSHIDFFIDYEFRNLMLKLLASAHTEMAVDRIIGYFIAEADRRYKAS